ncbi:MAG: hypothetical protein HF978_12675 [Desulfobacteraceae bacterium]|nr:hypothetical protein [Desulfobacteraceae bacterium]MBC2756393.1 hypothetical protein [Desulfobacteraceae bacterium]
MFDEEWRNNTVMERHLCTQDYLLLLLVMEMSLKPPEIRFSTITSAGLEVIEKARIKKEKVEQPVRQKLF